MKAFTVSQTGCMDLGSFPQFLQEHFPVQFLPEERCMEADFLFCDTFNFKHERFTGVKILFTGENHPVDLNNFDYCLTHDKRENDRCMYFPYWLFGTLFYPMRRAALTAPRPLLTADELRAQQRDFCAFVVRNAACRKRNRFATALLKRKHVNCGGPYMNNIGRCVDDKVGFFSRHLFGISFENESSPGYLTEKVVDAFVARCIPIYWGDPTIADTFDPAAMVQASSFRSDQELIDHVVELSEDYGRMAEMLNRAPLLNPQLLEQEEQRLLDFLGRIFEGGGSATRRTRWQRVNAVLSRFYGHGFFRTYRRISRKLRGKGQA